MNWEVHWVDVDVAVAELAVVDIYDIVGIFRFVVLWLMNRLLVVVVGVVGVVGVAGDVVDVVGVVDVVVVGVGVVGGVVGVVVVDNDEPSLLAD